MATERQAPDEILELSNLSGTVSEIQDDPDDPDSNWLDASSNNSDSVVRVSFPTTTGPPTVGSNLQEFRVLVRKYGGTGTPQGRIELYENGAFVQRKRGLRRSGKATEGWLSGKDFAALVRIHADGSVRCTWSR